MSRGLALPTVLLLALLASLSRVQAEPLVADLSNHLIAITTGFTGSDVLLFGATDGPGDVIALVRGPTGRTVVRRKERIMGIWINKSAMAFEDVPNFFAVSSSKPLGQLLTPQLAERYGIGLDYLGIHPSEGEDPAEIPAMLGALIDIKETEGLYRPRPGKIAFLGGQLFRADFHFPANVPTGSYLFEVLLLRDGKVASAQTTPLIVSKTGVGADVFEFAHRHAAAYGILSVLIALLAGWAAHLVFRRV
jgi:uncharacterized protein (TIGR02186 family)